VVVGEPSGSAAQAPHTVSCDALGLGVGAELTGEVGKELVLSAPDAWPGHQCDPATYSGPVSVSSDWSFELQPSDGGPLWGGVFAVRRGECTGEVRFDVSGGTADDASGFIEVSFSPDPGVACPDRCASRHAAAIEITHGEGGMSTGGSGGRIGSGGSASSTGGAGTGAGETASGGAASSSGGASGSGGAPSGTGGASGLDSELEQRMRAFCEADCASFEEIQPCYIGSDDTEEGCVASCFAGVRDLYYAVCPNELLTLLDCADEHPGAQDYSCDGTELTWSDSTCMPLAVEMRECVAAQGS